MDDHHELPYKAEYAKSGRASCKGCSGTIAKDSLRLAIMIQVHSLFNNDKVNLVILKREQFYHQF